MNDSTPPAPVFNGLAPLEPGKAPSPKASTSRRIGPDPGRSTSVRVNPNGGYVPPPEPTP